MSKPVKHITLEMFIDEMKRQKAYFKAHYPRLVREQKITPWESAHRIAVNEKLLNLLLQAKENIKTNGPKLLELLNDIPPDSEA